MNIITSKAALLLLATIPAISVMDQPFADELSELYLGTSSNNSGSAIPPNILFIIDTSGSMRSAPGFAINPVDFYDNVPYNPAVTYPGECDADHIYRRSVVLDSDGNQLLDEYGYPVDATGDSRFQSCNSPQFGFSKSTLVCKNALDDLDGARGWWWGGISEFRPAKTYLSGSTTRYYYVNDGVEQAQGSTSGQDMDGEWHSLSSDIATLDAYNGQTVWRDCPQDIGTHGWSDTTTEVWPTDETVNGYRTSQDTSETSAVNSVAKHVIASGNFLNWYEYTQTRLAAVQIAIREIARSVPVGTRIGLMRFDSTADNDSSDQTQGGMMLKEFVSAGVGTNTQDFVDVLFQIKPWEGAGTPLAESMLEAVYVYRGDEVKFGDISTIQDQDGNRIDLPSVAESRQSTNPSDAAYGYYESPIEYECQKNAVILLSDGDATSDGEVWWNPGDGRHLPNFTNYSSSNCGSECLPYLTQYLANEDLSSLTGEQTVTTHTVGFGTDISIDGQAYLEEAADNGGGSFTMANSFEDLRNAFQVIFRTEIAANQSLSSPAVTVNAFKRTAHKNDVYFTMFDPAFNQLSWPGNLKKYRLKKINGEYRITDALGQPALVDNSSAVAYTALSFWTDPNDATIAANGGRDGNRTVLGGAAGELTDIHLLSRKVYSWLDTGNVALASSSNEFVDANVTNSMVGLSVASTINKNQLINWIRGVDTTRSDWQTNPISRRAIGGAPHGVPAIVTYGGTSEDPDQVIYMPTNDGFLHAIDAQTGQELWSFIPTEIMGMFKDMYQAPSSSYIGYGLDASVIPHINDGGDGIISGTGEHAWIFFGMRRGGKAMYALNVTDKTSPKVMWRINGGDLNGNGIADEDFHYLAQTWSQPQIAKIRMGSSDTDGTPVLIFGGGYDADTQDSTSVDSYLDDTAGNALYIMDAESGSLLWWAGATGSGANVTSADMKSSIAADVEVKDKNDDGYADLLYAADVGGRIFRFDIDNQANTSTSVVAAGGMIASLGANGNSAAPIIDNRKFFAKPDVVLVARGGSAYWAINIGSGDRERPKSNLTTENWLFSIKDPNVFDAPSNYVTDYGITISDLYDVSDNTIQDGSTQAARDAALAELVAADGWKLKLTSHAGEKALAEAKTFDFRVYFTTFDPVPLNTGSCNSEPGTARLYTLDLLTAVAVHDYDQDGTLTDDDRSDVLTHGTIPPAVTFLFLEDEDTGIVTTETLIGRSDDDAPLSNNTAVRKTFWYIQSNDATEQ